MFYVRQPLGAQFRYFSTAHKALHWWYIPKPWTVGYPGHMLLEGARDSVKEAPLLADVLRDQVAHESPAALGRAYTYLLRSEMLGGDRDGAAPCERTLWTLRRTIESDVRFDDLPRPNLGQQVPYYPLRRALRRR